MTIIWTVAICEKCNQPKNAQCDDPHVDDLPPVFGTPHSVLEKLPPVFLFRCGCAIEVNVPLTAYEANCILAKLDKSGIDEVIGEKLAKMLGDIQ